MELEVNSRLYFVLFLNIFCAHDTNVCVFLCFWNHKRFIFKWIDLYISSTLSRLGDTSRHTRDLKSWNRTGGKVRLSVVTECLLNTRLLVMNVSFSARRGPMSPLLNVCEYFIHPGRIDWAALFFLRGISRGRLNTRRHLYFSIILPPLYFLSCLWFVVIPPTAANRKVWLL